MTLKTYIQELKKFAKKHPAAMNYEVMYSSDDEGNSYDKVKFSPSLSQVHDIGRSDNLEVVGNFGNENIAIEDCNAVCIN